VLACVCHPGCTAARCGPGPGLPGPARIAAWYGAARAGLRPRPEPHMACNPRMGNPEVAKRLVLGEHTACEVGTVAITEGDRAPGAAAPSFRADRLIHG